MSSPSQGRGFREKQEATTPGSGPIPTKHCPEAIEPERVNVSTTMKPVASQISGADVMILEGNLYEVCAYAWSPSGSCLASGSEDSTAQIWIVADKFLDHVLDPPMFWC